VKHDAANNLANLAVIQHNEIVVNPIGAAVVAARLF
jgi:hypothetical protein